MILIPFRTHSQSLNPPPPIPFCSTFQVPRAAEAISQNVSPLSGSSREVSPMCSSSRWGVPVSSASKAIPTSSSSVSRFLNPLVVWFEPPTYGCFFTVPRCRSSFWGSGTFLHSSRWYWIFLYFIWQIQMRLSREWDSFWISVWIALSIYLLLITLTPITCASMLSSPSCA